MPSQMYISGRIPGVAQKFDSNILTTLPQICTGVRKTKFVLNFWLQSPLKRSGLETEQLP